MFSVLSDLLRETREASSRLVFEHQCTLCGNELAANAWVQLCEGCVEKLPRLKEPKCAVCGEWYTGNISGVFRCANCADRRFDFDFAIAPFQARRDIRELVHRYKYGRELWLCETLGTLLATVMQGAEADQRLLDRSDWMIVPVPLHARRQREREFNQALELAKVFGRNTGLPVFNVLRRGRYTSTQASLRRDERLENLKKAFHLRPARWWRKDSGADVVNGRSILLVDDVFTTGATMQECAQILKKKGRAARVVALTLARG